MLKRKKSTFFLDILPVFSTLSNVTRKTTMNPTIKRSKNITAYSASGFSLVVAKTKSDLPVHILTFFIGERANSVLITRREVAYTLKNFKKVLDSSRKTA